MEYINTFRKPEPKDLMNFVSRVRTFKGCEFWGCDIKSFMNEKNIKFDIELVRDLLNYGVRITSPDVQFGKVFIEDGNCFENVPYLELTTMHGIEFIIFDAQIYKDVLIVGIVEKTI